MMYRDRFASFPYPIMSLITVRNQHNWFIQGLADSTRWLSPQDLNQNGDRVDDVWSALLEKHEEDASKPPDPNIKHLTPDYRVTELDNVEEFGLSCALVMDYSASMTDYFRDAEIAAKEFVKQMKKNDRACIIKFSGDIYVIQEFTSDTTLLRKAIEKDSTSLSGTAVYDAIYLGITKTLNQPGRRMVIVYTDGRDHLRGHTVDEVIEYGLVTQTPVTTIGLFGLGIDYENLYQIAMHTGGQYAFAPTVQDLVDIYKKSIFIDVRRYYALAYKTPDPYFNGTWRRLSVSITNDGLTGTGWGRYYVPFVPPNIQVDVGVETDSVNTAAGNSRYFLMAGDTASYRIRLFNPGLGQANQILVSNVLSDSLHPFGFSPPPQRIQEDTLFWSFPVLNPGDSLRIEYRASSSVKMPYGSTDLKSTVRVSCYRDSILADNVDSVMVTGLGYPDLAVQCTAPQNRMSPGYPVPVSAFVQNLGNADVLNPFRVGFFVDGRGNSPAAVDTIASLLVGERKKVETQLIFPLSGDYTVRTVADEGRLIVELNEHNNEDWKTVRVGIDTLVLRIGGISFQDTVHGKPGSFPYPVLSRITVLDQNTHVVCNLADTVKWAGLSDASLLGPSIGSLWNRMTEYHEENPSFPQNRDVRSGLTVFENADAALSPLILIDGSEAMQSRIAYLRQILEGFVDRFGSQDRAGAAGIIESIQWLQAYTQNKTLLKQAFNQSCTGKSRPLFDALYQSIGWVSPGTGGRSILAFTAGPDQGSAQTCSSVIRRARESGVSIVVVHVQTGSDTDSLRQTAEETGGWFFPASNDSLLEMAVDRAEGMLRHQYVLAHASSDTTRDRTWRMVEVGLSAHEKTAHDKGLYRVSLGFANAAVAVAGRGTESMVSSGDTTWTVRTNDRASFRFTVRNTGHRIVENVRLRGFLPHNLVPDPSGAYSVSGDTVQWLFPSIPLRGSVQADCSCRVDTVFTTALSPLITRASMDAVQDSILWDNTDADTIYYNPLKLADLSIGVRGTGDSTSVIRGDTLRYAHPGKTVSYRISMVNIGEMDCQNIRIQNILPERTALVSFPNQAYTRNADTLFWSVSRIESRGGSRVFEYVCKVDTFMPPWESPLVNRISASCVGDGDLRNNTGQDTVWAVGVFPPDPQVRLSTVLIQPRDTVSVEVMSPVQVRTWSIRIVFPNGERIDRYAETFIQATTLTPGAWIRIVPAFDDTRMRTLEDEEQVAVVFQTVDYWNVARSDTAYFTLRSSDEFYLDRNLYRPPSDGPLGIRFKISSFRPVQITIYDIAGSYVQTVADAPFDAGWNRTSWNGRNDRNETSGSGVYVAVFSSGRFKKALKFIVVR